MSEWHGNMTGALFFFAVLGHRISIYGNSAISLAEPPWNSLASLPGQADSAGLTKQSHISGIQLGLALLHTVAGPGPA